MKRGLLNGGKLRSYRPPLEYCSYCGFRVFEGDKVYEDDCGEFVCCACGEVEIEEDENA